VRGGEKEGQSRTDAGARVVVEKIAGVGRARKVPGD